MRINVKRLLSSLLFIALLIVLLIVSSLIFQPKNNYRKRASKDPMASGIYSEPADTIDAVFLGDSEAYCSFVPLKIWHDYGIATYVCGTTAQKLCYSVEILQNSFKNQNPEIVFLETNAIFRKFGRAEEMFQQAEKVMPILRYHDRWKVLSTADFSTKIEYTCIDRDKGYVYNASTQAADDKDYGIKSDEKAEILQKNINYVKEIKDFCDKNNARLVLVSTPSTKNWNYTKHNSIVDLADDLDVEYIDMNIPSSGVKIDWSKDSRDMGDHLNLRGALKATNCLGEYLHEQNMFEDKRQDPEYSQWNKSVDEFNKKTKNSLDKDNKDNKDKK